MRYERRLLALCLWISVCAGSALADVTAPPNPIAILDVNVVPMDRNVVLPHQTVIITEGLIAEMGSVWGVQVPDSAVVIDGEGRYLMPGLADMHAHLIEEEQLLLFTANGVTTIRNMFGSPDHLEWRRRIDTGELTGPAIYTAGPIIDGDPPVFPGSDVIVTPEQARECVRAQKEAGYDFLKVYNNLTLEVYDALIEAAAEADMPVAGHVPLAVGLTHVLASRQRCIEHLDGYERALASDSCTTTEGSGFESLLLPWLEVDSSKTPGIVRATREAGTWNCPTLIVLERFVSSDKAHQLMQRDEFRYMSPAELEYHDPETSYLSGFTNDLLKAAAAGNPSRKAFTGALHTGGARLLLGTDCGNPLVVYGFSLHEELKNLVDAGLAPYEAIKAGTVDAAEFIGAAGTFGAVAVGQRADLILLRANPLDDVANISDRIGVMQRGRWFPQAVLQDELDALAKRYKDQQDTD